ncbi:hypothetical protein Ddc_11193 [Ditylenchus destructor]|nr:hypothetical protein Ddc_11193 [Ditylenchus destructor]
MDNFIRGTGQLTWLSPEAGLITCAKPISAIVSFHLKDFCDVDVTDLTSVLCVGFRLAFHARATLRRTGNNSKINFRLAFHALRHPAHPCNNDPYYWIASHVSPAHDFDLSLHGLNDNKELDLEAIESNLGGAGAHKAHNKDPYSLEMEVHSLSFLLSIFHKNCVHFIPLSTLDVEIRDSDKEELRRYIGCSSRQFIQHRSHIFSIDENDVVCLQPPEIYTTLYLLFAYPILSQPFLFFGFNGQWFYDVKTQSIGPMPMPSEMVTIVSKWKFLRFQESLFQFSSSNHLYNFLRSVSHVWENGSLIISCKHFDPTEEFCRMVTTSSKLRLDINGIIAFLPELLSGSCRELTLCCDTCDVMNDIEMSKAAKFLVNSNDGIKSLIIYTTHPPRPEHCLNGIVPTIEKAFLASNHRVNFVFIWNWNSKLNRDSYIDGSYSFFNHQTGQCLLVRASPTQYHLRANKNKSDSDY